MVWKSIRISVGIPEYTTTATFSEAEKTGTCAHYGYVRQRDKAKNLGKAEGSKYR